MTILLHEGHEHTGAASTAVNPELITVAVIGALVGILVLGYAIKRYQSD
ncbi:hypothetical protein [Halobellus captivus]|nr:hypothetical protein [Halobellus captivus]